MPHSIKLSDEAYETLSEIAEEEGRSVTKQIEIWAKKLEKSRKKPYEDDPTYKRLSSKEVIEKAFKDVEDGKVINVGEYNGIEELLNKFETASLISNLEYTE